jgi:tight adherence protein C
MQFPYVIRALSLLIANGLPIAVAISWLAPRLSGFWGGQLSSIAKSLELGASLELELERLSSEVPLAEVEEFAQKLIIALDRGVPISAQLSELAGSLEAEMIRKLSKRAGANETKMLIPTIFLILPVTVLFAVFPSLLVLQASY